MDKIFVVTAPGLKPFATLELVDLGLLRASTEAREHLALETGPEREAGGIEFLGGLKELYAANLHLRTASRLLVRLGSFNAAAFSELRKKASRLPWEIYLKPGRPVSMRVTSHKSRLYHSGGIAERIAGAITDRLKSPPLIVPFDENSDLNPPQLIVVRLVRDLCTISLDSSGEGLHRRGYRQATAKAPLRETLAAAILLASEWDIHSPLLDPFCGSGTIPIEAAMMACRIAPGGDRRFAFMDWPSFDPKLWESLIQDAESKKAVSATTIKASDRDAGAINLAQANAERAGVGEKIEFSHRAISAIEPEGVGWIVTNPPYGLRVSGGKDLRNLYAQFGNVMRARCQGWIVAILSSQEQLFGATGLALDRKISMINGGVSVKLGLGKVG